MGLRTCLYASIFSYKSYSGKQDLDFRPDLRSDFLAKRLVTFVVWNKFLFVHLYDLLDVLDLVDELHLCHPLVVLELAD